MPRDPLEAGCAPACHSLIDAPKGGILALDLASVVGWCYGLAGTSIPRCGAWQLQKLGGEAARYASFQKKLAPVMERLRPSHLMLEAPLPLPAMNNWLAACQAFGLRAVALAEAWYASCPHSEVDAQTVRAEVMGSRPPREEAKQQVVAWCVRQGWAVAACGDHAHHAADACLLWRWFSDRVSPRRQHATSEWWG